MAVNVSNEFKEFLKNDKRNFIYYADVELTDGTVLNLSNENIWQGGFKIEDAVSGDDFQIGSAIINKLTLVLNNIYGDYSGYDFTNAVVNAAVGLELSNGMIEKVKKGVFFVDDPHGDTDLITLECLDNMAKFDRPYSESTLVYPATRGTIIQNACEICGVPLASVTFDGSDAVVAKRPPDDTLTFRQIVLWIAQLCCKWARCNTNGELEMGWYDEDVLMAENMEEGTYHDITFADYSTMPTISETDVVVTGIRILTEDEDGNAATHFYGLDGYVLEIEGNKLISASEGDTIAAQLGEKMIGFTFRPMQVSCLEDPTREAGDVFALTDDKGERYRSIITEIIFCDGDNQKISCEAETPGYKSSVRYKRSTQTYIALRKRIKAEQTARELAVANLQKTLADSSGLYTSEEKQEDGSTIYYLHDKPTLEESVAVIKLTAEAIGFSQDGGETYPYGFTLTGEMITRVLQTEGINADWINAGEFTVKDADGNVVFSANIDIGSVILSADSVMIGDKTIKQALKDVEASAKNMSIQMSNEYQAIPVDAEGNYTDFPECRTVITVMYGSADISSECTYTVTKSDAVTGSWDKSALTYIVSGLAADDGWVDIKATYAGTLSATKRFAISKVYAGEDGKDGAAGRTFILEPSVSLIKREEGDILNPGYLEFHSFYRDGAGTARNAYAGRFLIEETYDGNTWKTVYQSEVDESSVRHSLYSFIVDAEGNPVMTEEGYGIASDRAVQEVRCYVYAAGGFENLLDRQNIPVVYDMAALTQDKVFDILTNGGEAKGIYKEGNQLYISFTYARGGNLDLGGPNNGNGLLRILDPSGNQVGNIDNTGVNFEKGTITGTKIYGPHIFTYTADASGQVSLIDATLNFYDYNAEEGFQDAGSIYPVTNEIWVHYPQDDGSEMLLDTLAAGICIDSGHAFTISVTGLEAIQCIPANYYAETGAEYVDVYIQELISENITGETLSISGAKSRIVKDTEFGDRLMYCQESTTPYFTDMGTGILNEDGECVIFHDDIFLETVDCDGEYLVFLQKQGPGDLWVSEKEAEYFIVNGTPGLSFAWEIKAAQKGYENIRTEEKALNISIPDEGEDINSIFMNEINSEDAEMEAYLLESTESISDQ